MVTKLVFSRNPLQNGCYILCLYVTYWEIGSSIGVGRFKILGGGAKCFGIYIFHALAREATEGAC